jgi:xylan 1,4-beta-xylosidase
MEESIIVDAQSSATPLPHFWEHMFGSCHASTTLCEDWRKDLRALKEIVDVKYVRFHGIFERQVGIYVGADAAGRLRLNFTRADLIYDGILEIGVRPFVEVGFMPNEMASRPTLHSFWYQPNVAPPRDPDQWHELIYKFAQHLVERYGADEVAEWYFEVWNEPNLDFWTGDPQEESYYGLYDITATALKEASRRLRVGGPATAQAAWVNRFIQHCVEKNAPVDFVSTHVYPNDTAMNVFGTEENISQSEMVARAVRKVHRQVKASPRPDLPIIFSEYNAGFDPGILDSPYVGAWLANNIRLCAGGFVSEMSYWTFTEAFFEERGPSKSVFENGFGLVATGCIPKASFNAFKILHYLGDEQLALDSATALLTRHSRDGRLVLAVWNYVLPGETGSPKSLNIHLTGFPRDPQHARAHLVDDDHGSPFKTWKAIGSPDFPSREQQVALRMAAELPPPTVAEISKGKLALTLQPSALAVIEFLG